MEVSYNNKNKLTTLKINFSTNMANLPQTRIKTIMKTSEGVDQVSKEAVLVMAKAAVRMQTHFFLFAPFIILKNLLY